MMSTPRKRQRATNDQEEIVSGYVVSLSPMKGGTGGKKKFFNGEIETGPGEIATLVGWSADRQNELQQFMNSKTAMKFKISEGRTEVMPSGDIKYKIHDYCKFQGTTVEFASQACSETTFKNVHFISIGQFEQGIKCPACDKKFETVVDVQEFLNCAGCGMLAVTSMCSTYTTVQAVFKSTEIGSDQCSHHVELNENVLKADFALPVPATQKDILKKFYQKTVVLKVRDGVVTEINDAVE